MKKYKYFYIAAALLSLTSCGDYLDKMPDNRTEVNSVEKVKSLLVTAYPNKSPLLVEEFSSDNVTDNGTQYATYDYIDQIYRLQDVETISYNDAPYNVWSDTYRSVATANNALEALDKMEDNAYNRGLRAEALLCRAFAMFRLSNLFCMAYNPDKAEKYLGLPYPKQAGVTVPERGTLKELYANINEDIEKALPMIDDSHLTSAKYHFNKSAAYAFAARFNLYYLNFKKAKEYASVVVGSNPGSVLRQMSSYSNLAGVEDIGNNYVKSGNPSNLLLLTSYSLMGRASYSTSTKRYNHNMDVVSSQTFWALMPWTKSKGSSDNTLYESHMMYGNNQTVWIPKQIEFFEVTDKINNTGFAHIVEAAFTTDETLLVRAESEILLGENEAAIADMNSWCDAHCEASHGSYTRQRLTVDNVNKFFNQLDTVADNEVEVKKQNVKKTLHPQGFTISNATQRNLLYCLLQMRRIETFWQGQRFMDLKRYGIPYTHYISHENPIYIKPGDLRLAIQIPADVLSTGLEANPR